MCEPDLFPWDEVTDDMKGSIEKCLGSSYKELLACIKTKLNKRNREAGKLEAEHIMAALQVKYIRDAHNIQNRILYLTVAIAVLTVITIILAVITICC